MMPSIAIVIPSFNNQATIEETLASVAAQEDLKRVRSVYLADDASTDDTVATARAVWRSECTCCIFSQRVNQGERRNVNDVVTQLPPDIEWVLILHADDLAKPNWLSTLAHRIANCPPFVASICSSWDVLDDSGRVYLGEDTQQRPPERIQGQRDSVRGTLLRGCWWHISGCAIRVSAFRDIGNFLPDMPQLGDWEWLLRCLARGWSVEYVPRTLIRYRKHRASVSSTSFRIHRDVREALRIIRHYVGYLGLTDVVRFHGIRAYYLVRRVIASLIRLQIKRALRGLLVLGETATNLAYCLARNLQQSEPDTAAHAFHK